MTGKIERIVEKDGHGFIAGDDGQDYIFQRSALPEGEPFDQLLQGAAVTFIAVRHPNGLRAETVRLANASA
jgi:cold shock CspA family protein